MGSGGGAGRKLRRRTKQAIISARLLELGIHCREPEAANSTSVKPNKASSASTSITRFPASLVGSAPITITIRTNSAAENNGGSGKNDKNTVAIGAGVGIPIKIAALDLIEFLIYLEWSLFALPRPCTLVCRGIIPSHLSSIAFLFMGPPF